MRMSLGFSYAGKCFINVLTVSTANLAVTCKLTGCQVSRLETTWHGMRGVFQLLGE